MLVVYSLIVSLAVLAALFHFSRQRHSGLERKFDTLVLLRQLMQLCRQHRSLTHQALSNQQTQAVKAQLDGVCDAMLDYSNQLIANAPFENKPMYRILQLKLKSLYKDWDQRSVARNQVIHGKTIRHCMFLMDEIAIAWLIESGREDVSDEYHMSGRVPLRYCVVSQVIGDIFCFYAKCCCKRIDKFLVVIHTFLFYCFFALESSCFNTAVFNR